MQIMTQNTRTLRLVSISSISRAALCTFPIPFFKNSNAGADPGVQAYPGADPGGCRGAPLRNGVTNTNKSHFFSQNTSCIRKP